MLIAPDTHPQYHLVSTTNGPPRRLAVITGASCGIGEAFANHFAAQGYDLLITGRQRKNLYHVASKISKTYGSVVFPIMADLSVKQDVDNLLNTLSRLENIEILINNAGYSLQQRFSKSNIDDQLAMLDVHVNVPLKLVHSVLPNMISKKTGIIINISSLAANLPTSANAMYSSTKSFLKTFSESLYLDVKEFGIQVQCLCPGFTITNFHRDHNLSANTILPLISWMKPEEVVNCSIKNLSNKKVICIPGFRNKLINAIIAATPRTIYYLLARYIENKIRKKPSTTTPYPATKKIRILPVQYN